jgi:hypothetical protein
MGLVDIGNNQNGLNADTSYVAPNATILVPPGGTLPIGLPVTRNLLAGQGNYLAKYAALQGFGAYANGDSFVTLPLGGAVGGATSSWSVGVYQGQPIANPWLNPAAQTLNTTSLQQPGFIARSGVRLALCGLTNGGTTVKVGDIVAKGATVGTPALYPFLLSLGPSTATSGIAVGQVIATPIQTNITAAAGPGTGTVVTLLNTMGVTTATALTFNPGQANQETATPTAVTSTAPAISTLTIVGTAGSASTVQITFNIGGYQGSTGLTGPTGTNTTTFTISVAIPNGSTLAQTTNLILGALLASGFCYGAPQNIAGIGAGGVNLTSTAGTAGNPYSGPLVYAWSSAAGTIYFSACSPGAWANSLLTYTVTVLNGTTQTYNGNVAGSATAVAFASGVNGTATVTLANAHVAGEPVIGIQNNSAGVIVPAPGTAGMLNVGLCYVDFINL